MGKYRQGRVNEAVTEEVASIFRDVTDPRIAGVMVTITGADVSADLKNAKIFYSVLGSFDEKELKKGLKSVTPYVRTRLAHSLNLRQTPELMFVFDDSVTRGAEISSILKQLNLENPGTEPDDEDKEDNTDENDANS